MNLSTALVSIVLVFIVVLAVKSIIHDKRNNKSSCGGSCGVCGSHSLCHKSLYKEYKQEH
ncbi:MAG: FeoB-associated Cys-rich membrane protein [Faecalibacillus sp.]